MISNLTNFFIYPSRYILRFLVLFVLQLKLAESQTKYLSCETISDTELIIVGTVKTCVMDEFSKITSEGFVISSAQDLNVKALQLDQNKKIEFLPISSYQTFANLEFYSASKCSIKNISYQNFLQMNKLRALFLSENQIETIANDTFKDLAVLEVLDLGKSLK
jgi:DNA polymerase/3'-5' exonuclease PolX